jgi:Lrp/AsnC family transcriptional regulator
MTTVDLDTLDRKILRELQRDATRSIDSLAAELATSRTPVWSRIQKMRKAGVIERQVALVNPKAVGLNETFYVAVRTDQHEPDWLERFSAAVQEMPEILEAHRLAGDIDYLLRVQVRDPADFDRFYKALISRVKLHNVNSMLSMECLKRTTELSVEQQC